MWRNFKRMPIALKYLTFHGLVCSVLFVAPLVPGLLVIDGKTITLAEWWQTGWGPISAATGLGMTLGAMLFLLGRTAGRPLYLMSFGGGITTLTWLTGDLVSMIVGLAMTLALGAYLFKSSPVLDYFTPNNSFKGMPLRGTP